MYDHPDAYDRYMGRWSRQLAALFVDFVDARVQDAGRDPGDPGRLLDIGAGTGSLTSTLASYAPDSEIAAIDPVFDYIAHARRAAAGSNARFCAADAHDLPFGDGAFDAAFALLVLHGVADARKAVSEMIRVTRPGGRVAACEWDFRSGMDMLRLLSDAVVEIEPEADAGHARHTPLGGDGELRALWQQSGLAAVEEASLEMPLAFASFDDFWQPVLAGSTPVTALIAGLPPDKREAVKSSLRTRLGKERADGPFTLHAKARAVCGLVA